MTNNILIIYLIYRYLGSSKIKSSCKWVMNYTGQNKILSCRSCVDKETGNQTHPFTRLALHSLHGLAKSLRLWKL